MKQPTHAGGIVFRCVEGAVQYVLVSASDDPTTRVLPKGHIERDETAEQAAVREVREEAGIEARIVHDLGIIRFTRKNEDTRVQFFLMRYEASVGAAEKRTVMWVPFADAQRLLTHEDARELLLAAQPAVVANLAVAVSSEAAQTLLLKDYDSLTQALANNESLGDTRLNFFVGLVTAVLSGLVALALSESEKAQALSASVTLFAGISLLALGIVVLFRIIHRNSVTDGYRKDLDRIRAIFRVHLDMGGVLQSYRPFGHASNQDDVKRGARFKLRRFGGLADTVAVINSVLLASLLILPPVSRDPVDAAFVSALLLAVQCLYVRYRDWKSKTPGK